MQLRPEFLSAVIFDVDGVFTDGSFFYDINGKFAKRFGAHDADGVKILRAHTKAEIIAISADKRGFAISKRRMADMGLELNMVSEHNRYEWLDARFDLSTSFFMGDGHFDAPLLKQCRFGATPKNAVARCIENADYVTLRNGGDGAVYEASLWLLEQLGVDRFELC